MSSAKKASEKKKSNYRYDFHVHTTHSDGAMTVKQAVIQAKKDGLDGIAITDHDTVSGLEEAEKECKKHGLLFVPGLEITTPGGDILAWNVREKIVFEGDYNKVIDTIHKKGGLAILAHPFAAPLPEYIQAMPEILKKIDAIEVFNGGTHMEGNMQAIEFAKKVNMPGVAGSDAHNVQSIGSAYMGSKENTVKGLMEAVKKGEVVVGIV